MSLGVVHCVGHILIVGAQAAVKALADPQHETAVRALVIPKDRAVGQARRDEQIIAVFQHITFVGDLVGDISLQEKIKFIIIVLVGGNVVQIDVIVVKELEIAGLHVLACCEVDGERLFHGMCSFKTGKWERRILLRFLPMGIVYHNICNAYNKLNHGRSFWICYN